MALELTPLESEDSANKPADFKPKAQQTKYVGAEHRLGPRRLKADRRALLRFEPDKQDRRSGNDRRAGGNNWNNLYNL